MSILGAIVGDVVGSAFEHDSTKRVKFTLLSQHSRFTDDTVMTLATARAILSGEPYEQAYRELGRKYPHAGYGGAFRGWLMSDSPKPYGSWGNGSAMRVSPVGCAFTSVDDVLREAERSAAVTHDHAEGIKGAQSVALAVFLARTGSPKEEIRTEIETRFGYDLRRTVESIRPTYSFHVSCQGSVPEALLAFFDAESAEEAIRLSVSLGGDSDTQACIAGAVAQAHFRDLKPALIVKVRKKLPADLLEILEAFEAFIPSWPPKAGPADAR